MPFEYVSGRKATDWNVKMRARVALYRNYDEIKKIPPMSLKQKLKNFEDNLPEDYELSAKESVNNKKERIIRDGYLQGIIEELKP